MLMRTMATTVLAAACAIVLGAAPARAQDGAGSTGAAVLQLLAGGRAAAFSGAYSAATNDADVVFYNPAGIAGLLAGAGFSYQRQVLDIGLASASGAYGFGRFVLGAGAVFLDYGDVDEMVPDPVFGGQTGTATGNTVGASEIGARVVGAGSLMDGRLNIGAAVGIVSTDLAGASRSAPFVDAGVQYALPRITLAASVRNIGGAMSGGGLADAELPSEARLGAMFELASPNGFGAVLAADLVSELNAGTTGVVAGVEAGLLPGLASRVGAVGRVGWAANAGDEAQGALQLGAGLSLGPVAVDYAYQNYDLFGALHRFGVRWSRLP
jgi:hypothetical protein